MFIEYNGDHPHACGDKLSCPLPYRRMPGSSPRVWGQDRHRTQRHAKRRIIPTRVGTRAVPSACNTSDRDHPHACGDKTLFGIFIGAALGSSPRVWGQGPRLLSSTVLRGIIPTRVGTSKGWQDTAFSKGDHPHACGDKIYSVSAERLKLGSSPRVWGQVLF